LILLQLIGAGCPENPDQGSGCPQIPGCVAKRDLCCNSARLCTEEICEGAAWTCKRDPQGEFRWGKGSCDTRDSGAPLDGSTAKLDTQVTTDGCLCAPGKSKLCERCNAGTQTCTPDCKGYGECQGLPANRCQPKTSEACPNGCGDRTCSDTCTWGDCSRMGMLQVHSADGCWSANHCGIPGNDHCVWCWLVCDAKGDLHKDAWCASCPPCDSPEDPPCP
jgi:hypothetical protein